MNSSLTYPNNEVKRGRDLGFKSHLKDRRRRGIDLAILGLSYESNFVVIFHLTFAKAWVFISGRTGTTQLVGLHKLFEIGYFPEEWSVGFIIPLHRKRSINEVEHFRGISLLENSSPG